MGFEGPRGAYDFDGESSNRSQIPNSAPQSAEANARQSSEDRGILYRAIELNLCDYFTEVFLAIPAATTCPNWDHGGFAFWTNRFNVFKAIVEKLSVATNWTDEG